MLCGCADPDPYELGDYLTRLSRVLETEIPAVDQRQVPQMPRVRDVRFESTAVGVDILEFLRLGECELQQWIAERNSSLGRLATDSQRLVYELNFLRLADVCIQTLASDHPSLAGDLRKVADQKQQMLPRLIWQSILAGPEFRDYWSHRHQHWSDLNETTVSDALIYLDQQVSRWLAGHFEVSGEKLELALSVLRTGDGGTLLHGWREVASRLTQANLMIDTRLLSRPLCYKGMVTPRREVLQRVVNRFTGKVQEGINQLSESRYEQISQIQQLESRFLDVEPELYRRFRHSRDALLESAATTPRSHVESLRPLLTQCELLPGSRTEA